MEPLLLSTGQAAKRLGIGKTKLLSIVRSGRLPCVMLDGRIRVAAKAIEAFTATLPKGYVPGKQVRP